MFKSDKARESARRRLAKYVDRSGGPDACHPFTGGRDKDGYGRLSTGSVGGGAKRTLRAHRVAYHLEHGHEARGVVMHTCDNPPCCNPAHLRDATQIANVHDAREKGRHATGERHGAARLSAYDAKAIRAQLRLGWGNSAIARQYGVTPQSVSHIKLGKTWRDGAER